MHLPFRRFNNMKNWILKYSLEIFSTVVLLFTGVILLFFPEISYIRKISLCYAILAVLHEFEEKRIPGGFFELMAKKFGIPLESTNLDLAGFLSFAIGWFLLCYRLCLMAQKYSWLCPLLLAFLKHLFTLWEYGFII